MWAETKNRIKNVLKEYQAIIGGALIVFGGTYQIINAALWGWWNPGTIITTPTFEQQVSLTLGFLAYPLFVLSFSLAAIGFALIIAQEPKAPLTPPTPFRETLKIHKKKILGILLTTFGATYQIIGAWIMWDKEYPWAWQKEIAKYGAPLLWPLFIISLLALIAGATLLYQDSKLRKLC